MKGVIGSLSSPNVAIWTGQIGRSRLSFGELLLKKSFLLHILRTIWHEFNFDESYLKNVNNAELLRVRLLRMDRYSWGALI